MKVYNTERALRECKPWPNLCLVISIVLTRWQHISSAVVCIQSLELLMT